VQLLTLDGETIVTTPNHPFYTIAEAWVAAGELQVGDWVRDANGSYGMVEAITFVYQPQPMYNLTVDVAHTYFVGDGQWLVHNCGQYPEDEWKKRHEILDYAGKPYQCWMCAWLMQFGGWGDKVILIHLKPGQNLFGPGGTDIGAPNGWHMIAVDRFDNAWDNWGFQGRAKEYIDPIVQYNPGAKIVTFTDIKVASNYMLAAGWQP
jgi:hypothetical protein